MYDNNTAKMTSGAKNYRRNKNHLEWQNRNGAPRLIPKIGQDNFSRNVVGDVYMAPTKVMKSGFSTIRSSMVSEEMMPPALFS